MPFVVNGTAAERATIEGWLRQICSRISVNPGTGAVTIGPAVAGPPAPGAPPTYETGCACLSQLISGPRTATIQPMPGPGSLIPGMGGMTPAHGGGAATIGTAAGSKQPNGSPGKGPDGNVGCDCTTYIDMSNNGGRGYPHGNPMWLVLAHELTSGHAFHMTQGTDGPSTAEAEKQAIESENTHAEEHGLPKRPVPAVPAPPAPAPAPAPTTPPSGGGGGWF